MPISIDLLKKKAAKARALPQHIMEALINEYSNSRDLDQRLWLLPIVPKGRFLGTFPNTNVSKYAVETARSQKLDVYVGYFVYKHEQTKRWRMHEHVFNVDPKTGRVVEHAKGLEWGSVSYYIGLKVPDLDSEFVADFSQIDYLYKHSPRALISMPTVEVDR